MRTARKLAAILTCAALLSVVGVTAAGAQDDAKCDRLGRITERIAEKQARVAARAAKSPRVANAQQKHQVAFQTKVSGLAEKLADLQQRCAG